MADPEHRAPARGGKPPPQNRAAAVTVGVVAVAALGGFFVWKYVLHTPDAPTAGATATLHTSPAADPTPRATTPDPVRVAQPPPAQPQLPATDQPPALPDGAPAQTAEEVFSVEPRDAAWAPAIEAEITERLGPQVTAKLTTECHTSRCRIRFDGATDDVSRAISRVSSKKGLLEFADSIYMTRPTVRDDGTMQLEAYATFTR